MRLPLLAGCALLTFGVAACGGSSDSSSSGGAASSSAASTTGGSASSSYLSVNLVGQWAETTKGTSDLRIKDGASTGAAGRIAFSTAVGATPDQLSTVIASTKQSLTTAYPDITFTDLAGKVATEDATGYTYAYSTQGVQLKGDAMFIAHGGSVYTLNLLEPAENYTDGASQFHTMIAIATWK